MAYERCCFEFKNAGLNHTDKHFFHKSFSNEGKTSYSTFSTLQPPKLCVFTSTQTYTFSQPDYIICACISDFAYFVLIRYSTLFNSLLFTEHSSTGFSHKMLTFTFTTGRCHRCLALYWLRAFPLFKFSFMSLVFFLFIFIFQVLWRCCFVA